MMMLRGLEEDGEEGLREGLIGFEDEVVRLDGSV